MSDPRLPRYQQIRDDIARKIADQVWPLNQSIPAESDLASTYGVAIGTVRQAVDVLMAEGLLERLQGKGTFVRRPSFSSSLFRFFRHHSESGEPIMPTGKVLSRSLKIPPVEVANALAISTGLEAIAMSRMRLFGDREVLKEDIWLPKHRFPGFLDLAPEELEPLLYPAYEQKFGVLVASAEETLMVEAADETIASALGVALGAPLMVIERSAFDQERKPVEWRRSYGSAAGFRYKIEVR